MRDKEIRRRQLPGLKITEDHVRLFRACRGHVRRKDLMALFDISWSHLGNIQLGYRWSDVV